MSDPALAQREISTSIEEVVVTAQKREENLSDVPMAVSALDGKALDRTIARDLQDIQDMSPNIMIDPIPGNGRFPLCPVASTWTTWNSLLIQRSAW